MSDIIKRGRGRPRKEPVDEKIVSVRIQGDDLDKLTFLAIEEGMPYSDVLKKGLNMVYNLNKYRQF